MQSRSRYNTNLILTEDKSWRGYPVLTGLGPLVVQYLDSIYGVISRATEADARCCAIRFDVHLPEWCVGNDSTVISRFTRSLRAIIKADQIRKHRDGKRYRHTDVRYCWVKEYSKEGRPHYHFFIILNREVFFTLGKFRLLKEGNVDMYLGNPRDRHPCVNMAERIALALARALQVPFDVGARLIHFADQPVYFIDSKSEIFDRQFGALFRRVSYFAKESTKQYGSGANNFGCSRI